jgi:hypothetical protein
MRRRSLRATPRFTGLEKSAEECRRFIRDADNLVGCLTVEFEIELCFEATVEEGLSWKTATTQERFGSS